MITLLKANENNLKNIDLNLPNNCIIVVTGVSGSGKSTLVYDIIYQEARRRYLQSFSANAQQFMGKLNRPNVQNIYGLSPAIALEQKNIVKLPTSTVGTLTEIYDLLRLLFARIGKSDKINKPSRSLLSFNSEKGACTHCKGLGVQDEIDTDLLIIDTNKTIRQGAFAMTTPSGYIVYSQVTMDVLEQICYAENFSVDIPWKELTPEQRHIVLYGSNKIIVPFGKHTLESRMKWTGMVAKPREEGYYKGIIPVMNEILKRDRNINILRFTKTTNCPECNGTRLNSLARSIKIHKQSIADLSALSIDKLICFLKNISFTQANDAVGTSIKEELLKTLEIIQKLGLGFLNINRPSASLSGGETQRLRLAKLVSSGLRGILYVFDEPSVGLHQRDAANLMEVLRSLGDNGNTVILVEHSEFIMRNSDWIVDMGVGAGENGGEVLFNGLSSDFFAAKEYKNSKTLQHINSISNFKQKLSLSDKYIEINGASANNLKNINVKLKLNALNVITGVSGAGKTTLIKHTLAKYFDNKLNGKSSQNASFQSFSDKDEIRKLVIVDQNGIGKTPRSNPATYIGLSDVLRNFFASLDQAKQLNFGKSYFSFNTKGGRCKHCQGAGYLQIGMQMLGTVEVLCSKCKGKQFNNEVLKVKYKNYSIADIYSMNVENAMSFFKDNPKIYPFLKQLNNLGLGYLKLNQRSSTLSGGEARRVKLAKSLVKMVKQHTLYIIDEPSSGLHASDVMVMLQNLNQLVEQGHTVVLKEHHGLFIKAADYLVDLGPGSGEKGGKVVFQGVPKQILDSTESITAKALRNEYSFSAENKIKQVNNLAPIQLTGICTHNLKNITVEIPVNKLTVLTGVSGSGKSSLAFDTLFVEGRQRYVESFSAYVRNRLNINSQAKYETIKGIMPTIAVDSKSSIANERSTVGTQTGIYDFLRLLYSRVGKTNNLENRQSASAFSFNHEQGACVSCQGLGYQMVCDEAKLVAYPEKSLLAGALAGSKPGKFYGDEYGQYVATLKVVGAQFKIDYCEPYQQLSAKAKKYAMHGTKDLNYKISWQYKRGNRTGEHQFNGPWLGFVNYVNQEYLRKVNDKRVEAFESIMSQIPCVDCQGKRLNKKALEYTFLGKDISEISEISIKELLIELQKSIATPKVFSNSKIEQKAAQVIVENIINGIRILDNLGLGYLSLSRAAKTLSGGEAQRVRLASCIAQNISGVCIILDEPTSGLHSTDIEKLVSMINELKKQGNTVVVCEHDADFIRMADKIIDLGPEAGINGGNIIAQGSVSEIINNKNSITGKYLGSEFTLSRKKILKETPAITILKAHANNLKEIDVSFPLNKLVIISGVSGSGKSSLLNDVIFASIINKKPTNCILMDGLDNINNVIYTNQHLPKAHANSFIAGFLNLKDELSELFANTDTAKSNKFKKAHFMVNNKLGRCPKCQGNGYIKTSMDFLSDITEVCETCNGQRFNSDILACKLNGESISNYLNFSLDTLQRKNIMPKAKVKISMAIKLGLGYITLGQNLNTLSGGELQRLKLTKALIDNKNKPTLFLLDEPTIGLHMKNVQALLNTFDYLLDNGHSLLVIEHNLQLIKNADYIIQLGPGAGSEGGKIVLQS